MSILYHIECCRHSIYICCYSYKVYRTVCPVMYILLVVTSSYICHNGNLQVCVIITNNFSDSVIFSKFPFSKLVCIKHFFVGTIAKFHIIYSCLYICKIKISDKLVCKIKIVDKTSVTNCCVQYLYVRTE